ncbi:MAG: quinolinate synthase NadA [Chloroflexota bacterium]
MVSDDESGLGRRPEAEFIVLREEVLRLKQKLNAVIVAHNYQHPEVQDIADFVGDSLELARRCAEIEAETIVFCGVDFMAETAAILNPHTSVLLSAATACCPMAAMIDEATLKEWKKKYPEAAVVSYVNTSAAIKAMSDICCTSANSVRVVESMPNDEIIFVPDRNLGQYVANRTKKHIILYPGFCITHDRLTAAEVRLARRNHPEAKVMVHPECREEVIALADVVLSTSQMSRYAKENPATTFLVGTEMGLLYRLHKENPEKKFYLLSSRLICAHMKITRLETVIETMKTKKNLVTVPEETRLKAKKALDRMLTVV